MSHSDFFTDLFDEEARSVGKALLAMTAVGYFAKQADESTLFRRDDVQYAIDAYLTQGYDRGIIASRASQRLAKSIIVRELQINTVKERVRLATGREAKLTGLSDLFVLSLACILSAAHVNSLIIALHVVKNMALVLVYVLRKQEGKKGSSSGSVMSKLRSWWSGGTQGFIMQTFMETLQQQREISPFALAVDNDIMTSEDIVRCFSVESLLSFAIPHVVETAVDVVKTTLQRHPPHMFTVTGVVTGRDVRELLDELGREFESRLMWPRWLTAAPAPSSSSSGEKLPTCVNGNSEKTEKRILAEPDSNSDDSDEVIKFPAGSTGILREDASTASQLQRDRAVLNSVFGPPRDEMEEDRAMREEARREELARAQAAGFFLELIHSDSFSEICIAYGAEVFERASNAAADLRHVSSYDAATDTAKTMHMFTALENQRLQILDLDFTVPLYLRLFCEETIKATCRKL